MEIYKWKYVISVKRIEVFHKISLYKKGKGETKWTEIFDYVLEHI